MIEKYHAASKMLNTSKMVLNGNINANWIDNNNFVYDRESYINKEVIREKINFNCSRMQKQIIENIEKKAHIEGAISPNGLYSVFFDKFNLKLKNLITNEENFITNDGYQWYDYGSNPGTNGYVCDVIKNHNRTPGVLWSNDSKKILTYKLDQRKVGELNVIQNVVDNEENHRPRLISYKYPFPNDEYLAEAYLCIYDIDGKTLKWVDGEPLIINYNAPVDEECKKIKWTEDSKYLYYTSLNRYFNEAKFNVINVETLISECLLIEKSNTFLFLDTYGVSDGTNEYNFTNYLYNNCKYFIWQSDNTGRSMLYLYDFKTKKLINKITSEKYIVKSIIRVDENNDMLYFIATGFEGGSDPYYEHLCKIKIDGSNFSKLTKEDAFHEISLSPNGNYFIDTYSRVDCSPRSMLKDNNGNIISEIEKSDISILLDSGYVIPERFCIKASDGMTDLYGIMIKPPHFDENKKYPLIDYIYGGVQNNNVPKKFTWTNDGKEIYGGLESLAQLGFIGIILDGPGTPKRGKCFHDVCYKNLQSAAGLSEHVYCVKKLYDNYKYIDINKIGIWGTSGGGYATVRALCEYPEFYKVGVSIAGNHDERAYCSYWVERYNGEYNKVLYDIQDNSKIIKTLEGKLLLVHGDLDDNVHVSNTLRVVNELMKKNKDFDMIIVPNEFHDVAKNKYVIRKKWDYFVENLLGENHPKEYLIN